MLLSEALELLKAGKIVSRESWLETDGYLSLMHGMSHIWKVMLKPQPNAGNYIMSFDDLGATDWCEYDAAKFAPKAESCDANSLSDAA